MKSRSLSRINQGPSFSHALGQVFMSPPLQDHTESTSLDEVVGQLVRTELEDTGVLAMNISIQEKFQHILSRYGLIHLYPSWNKWHVLHFQNSRFIVEISRMVIPTRPQNFPFAENHKILPKTWPYQTLQHNIIKASNRIQPQSRIKITIEKVWLKWGTPKPWQLLDIDVILRYILVTRDFLQHLRWVRLPQLPPQKSTYSSYQENHKTNIQLDMVVTQCTCILIYIYAYQRRNVNEARSKIVVLRKDIGKISESSYCFAWFWNHLYGCCQK